MVCLCACGGGAQERPTPRADAVVARPLETYRNMGLLAGPPEFPAVVDLVTIAGPADSTWLIIAMSLPNSALRFQREENGFAASYEVAVELRRGSAVAQRISRSETVRVPSFAETGRTDESVIFQEAVALEPGGYTIALRASAGSGSGAFEAVDTIDVPGYGTSAALLGGPLFIFEGAGRTVRAALPRVVLNPRHTTAYGAADPLMYVEWYDAGAAIPLDVRILDDRSVTVERVVSTIPAGSSEVRSVSIELPVESLPLGPLTVEVIGPGMAEPARGALVLSISDQWMVADFEEVLQFLRFIAASEEVATLREGTPQERRERWESFWRRRDPIPATPANEFRDQFFDRVRYATEHFGEGGGLQGWHTDRGEVYIVLGPPDFTQERYISRTDLLQPDGIEWIYDALPGGRLSLLFLDRAGFGRYELTPASESAFRAVADRLKPRSE